jgi:hypothetical protein
VNAQNIKRKVFIGHGRSKLWLELQSFIEKRIGLSCLEFNSEPQPGNTTVNRLKEMLEAADFAFIVMTAEDEHADGKMHARSNVIHEIGLFQGRLGFQQAIILSEEDCEAFSNIHGLTVIQFTRGRISAVFEEVREVLERPVDNRQDSNMKILNVPINAEESIVPYDFKIVSPGLHETVDKPFEIAGSWNPHAGPAPLAVIITKDESSKRFWFHEKVDFDRHTWRCKGCDCDDEMNHEVYLAILGKNAEILFNYYHDAGLENRNWVGIPKLPTDVTICDTVQVYVKKRPRRRLL